MLIQVGGFGIMTLASLLTLLLARRIGLATRLITQTETQSLHLGDLRRVVVGVAVLSAAFESAAAVIIAGRLWLGYDYSFGAAVYRVSSTRSRRSTTPDLRCGVTASWDS